MNRYFKAVDLVKLNKIYTRTGDDGQTVLVNGQRVAKHAKRPAAFGEIDELNSVIGITRNFVNDTQIDIMLARIQNDLFDLGADLATPEMEGDTPCLRITENQVKRIEKEIDVLNTDLSDLSSFILPGGSSLSSWLHFARTVARRAEREIASLAAEEPINKFAMHFINRLSDHLFVLARVANNNGKSDVLWVPGAQTGKLK